MIAVEGISKAFRLYRKPSDRLREIILRRSYHTVHQALSDISFVVEDGQTLGIIGCNGAGKSTLLKILTGVLLPDQGQMQLSGRITGLLELGTGFNMELSGLENIRANAMLLGMSTEQIAARRDTIVEFAELGAFINEPLKTYSSGMIMRLAFAIAIHADPACFVVDEALAVGDAYFQQKCMRAIHEFCAQGGSIIFVSHDLNAIKMLCNKVLVLDHGRMVGYDDPETAANLYNRIIARIHQDAARDALPQGAGYGTGRAWIEQARICGQHSQGTVMAAGEIAELSIDFQVREPIADLTLGLMIRDRFGQDIFGTNTHLLNIRLDPPPHQIQRVGWRIPLNIAPGKYTITLALHRGTDHSLECLHWNDKILEFEIAGVLGPHFGGICRLEPEFFS